MLHNIKMKNFHAVRLCVWQHLYYFELHLSCMAIYFQIFVSLIVDFYT